MQSFKNSFASFWKYRYLLQNLITRDFKLKYRRSVLGVAWSVLNPLLTCLVMFLVFDSIMKGLRGEGIPNFAGFLIIGQLLFNFFRESTSMAMESVLKTHRCCARSISPSTSSPWRSAALRWSTVPSAL